MLAELKFIYITPSEREMVASWFISQPHPFLLTFKHGAQILPFCGQFFVVVLKAIYDNSTANMGFPGGTSGKEPTCPSRRHKRCEFNPWVRKIPWKRAWQLTSVFLPGELYGQRTLAATVHRVTKSHKWLSLKQLSMHSQYNTQWWKAESLSAKIWNKSRMPHLQHISSI